MQENKQERQTAVTERITVLEAEAEAAAEAAEAAKVLVEGKLAALEKLRSPKIKRKPNGTRARVKQKRSWHPMTLPELRRPRT